MAVAFIILITMLCTFFTFKYRNDIIIFLFEDQKCQQLIDDQLNEFANKYNKSFIESNWEVDDIVIIDHVILTFKYFQETSIILKDIKTGLMIKFEYEELAKKQCINISCDVRNSKNTLDLDYHNSKVEEQRILKDYLEKFKI
jgi:hypothetical protein